MMTFQATGIIRDIPEEIQGLIAFILISDDRKTMIPIAVKENKLQERVKRELIIGAKVEVSGTITSTFKIINGKHTLRLWLVADKVKIIHRSIVTFKRNLIFNKLLEMVDLDNLFSFYQKQKEKDGGNENG